MSKTYVLNQEVQSGNSPETLSLRDGSNQVPSNVAAYEVTKVIVADESASQNDVSVQNYDNGDNNVDEELVIALASNATERVGEGDDDTLLTVPRGNQIRLTGEGDVDFTVYITPDSL